MISWQVSSDTATKRYGHSLARTCESRLHAIVCCAQSAMLVTLCPQGVLLDCEIKGCISPKPHRFSGRHQRYSAVLFGTANGTFHATLHSVVVGHHWLQNDVIITAIIHHVARGEFFDIIYAQVAKYPACSGDVLFQKYER